ncbi:MAG: hypothetical protein SCH39_07430 [Methanosarcinales archaeon]|nr:hypothetical protein [ANME-2 cluster archaeon]MDF1531289.1 hypothetical protein [ANME-2 cluster archaeon]MDW7776147.1 hypothetical protein [Methanosarcinales archaeon]
MSLPTFCPKTGSGSCIGDRCPVYVTDWRSKDEYCNVGYYPDHERTSHGEPVVDNYASGNKVNTPHKSDAHNRLDLNSMLHGLQECEENAARPEVEVTKPKNKVHRTMNLMDLGDLSDDYEAQFWA